MSSEKLMRKLKRFTRSGYWDEKDRTEVCIKDSRAYATDGYSATVRAVVDTPDKILKNYPTEEIDNNFKFKTGAVKIGTITKQKITQSLNRVKAIAANMGSRHIGVLVGEGRIAFRLDSSSRGQIFGGYLDDAIKGTRQYLWLDIQKFEQILRLFTIREPLDFYVSEYTDNYVSNAAVWFTTKKIQVMLMQSSISGGLHPEMPEELVNYFNNLK